MKTVRNRALTFQDFCAGLNASERARVCEVRLSTAANVQRAKREFPHAKVKVDKRLNQGQGGLALWEVDMEDEKATPKPKATPAPKATPKPTLTPTPKPPSLSTPKRKSGSSPT